MFHRLPLFIQTALAQHIIEGDPESFTAAQLPALLARLAVWLVSLAGGIAIIFIIWGGIQYLTSTGDPKKLEQAKNTLTYALGGLILIILSRVIILFACRFFAAPGSGFCA